ncbi:MAG: ATP-binding protein [Candidatus Cloacimonadota bacterium]|nr:MAG: ATP-binding protein [Candidatus Cloacimonadota bacterium]
MNDISLHLSDIIENSVRADASLVIVNFQVDIIKNILEIEIIDNGKGMDAETLSLSQNPFYTSKSERKKSVGLGIPLLRQNTELCNGYFSLESNPGEGTSVKAGFAYDNIDRMPAGNISDTILTSVIGHPETDFLFNLKKTDHSGVKSFEFSTVIIKEELGEIPINYPEVIPVIESMLTEGIINTGMEEL